MARKSITASEVELLKLAGLMQQGLITDLQFARLEELLRKSGQMRESYILYSQLCAELDSSSSGLRNLDFVSESQEDIISGDEPILDEKLWLALAENERTAESISIEEPLPEKPPREFASYRQVPARPNVRHVSKVAVASLILSLAAIVLIAIMMVITPQKPPLAANLADSVNAQWDEGLMVPNLAGEFRQGQSRLKRGFAKIEMLNGAELILQGPCSIEFKGTDRVFLYQGRLYSKVLSPQARGFTVETADAEIVDFGTEFGVIVDKSGRVQAHVFKGSVELTPSRAGRNKPQKVKLISGQAGLVQGSKITKTSSDIRNFFNYIPSSYELAVRANRPAAYFRFSQDYPQGVINLADYTVGTVNYVGDVSFSDLPFRQTEKFRAIQLGGDKSYVYLSKFGDRRLETETESRIYSYSIWVKPEKIRAQHIIASTNDAGLQYRQICMDQDGHFVQFMYEVKNKREFAVIRSDTAAKAGRWYNITITASAKDIKKMYINGREEGGPVEAKGYLPKYYGNVYVGYAPEPARSGKYGSFCGSIAEIAEYNKVLGKREIEQLHKAAAMQRD